MEIKRADKANHKIVGLVQADLWTNFWGNKYLTFRVRVLLIGTLTNGNPYLNGKGFVVGIRIASNNYSPDKI